jgi:hypothetical protein
LRSARVGSCPNQLPTRTVAGDIKFLAEIINSTRYYNVNFTGLKEIQKIEVASAG